MSRRTSSAVPAAVRRVAARLEMQRRTRGKGQRIPEELWQSAALLAQEHGVSLVARSLSLDYYTLKERALEAEAEVPAPAGFVEFSASDLAGLGAPGIVQLESASGHKMTLHLPALNGDDAARLATAFLRGAK